MQVQVPTTQTVFSNTTANYQQGNVNPGAFGADVGVALQNIGAKMSETSANQADLQLGIKLNNLTFDPKTGFMTKNGQDAIDGLKDYQQKVQDAVAEVRGTLDPVAQRMFDQVATRRALMAAQQGAEHASQQAHIVEGNTYQGQIALDSANMANTVNDPKNFELYGRTLDQHVLQFSQWQGNPVGGPAEAELIANHRSAAYANAIMQTMAQDPSRAQELFDKYGDYLTAPAHEAVNDRLTRSVQDQDTVNISDSTVSAAQAGLFDASGKLLVSSTDAIHNMGRDVEQQTKDNYLAKHPGDTVGAQRAGGMARAKWSEEVYAPAVEQQHDNFAQLLNQVDLGHVTQLGSIINNPQLNQLYQGLDPKLRVEVDSHVLAQSREDRQEARADRAEARYNAQVAKQDRTEQSSEYRDALYGLSITDPDRFLKLDPAEFSKHMTTADTVKVTGWIKQANEKNQVMINKAITSDDVKAMWPVLKASGIDPESKSPSAKLNYNSFVGRLNDAARQQKANTQKPLQEGDLERLAAPLLSQYSTGKTWYGADKNIYGFQVNKSNEATITQQIDASDRQRLTAGFTKAVGRAPTESEIQQARIAEQFHANDPAYLRNLWQSFRSHTGGQP